MELKINTETKTITLKHMVNLKELHDTLKSMLGDTWEEYSIQMGSSPIVDWKPNHPYQSPPFNPLAPIGPGIIDDFYTTCKSNK